MKKILFFLSIIIGTIHGFSQRKADLSFELLEPKSGAFVEAGVNFKFTVKIKNLSAYQVEKTDTLRIYLMIDGDTVLFNPVRSGERNKYMIFDNKLIANGDSITFWNIMQLPMEKQNKTVSMCFSLQPHNGTTLEDTIISNNSSCVQVIAKKDPASIQQLNSNQSIICYPNPANQLLYFNKDLHTQSATLLDMSGNTISTMVASTNTIDCTNIANGMYIIRSISADGVHSQVVHILHN